MRDVELYQQLLGVVSPWTVSRVIYQWRANESMSGYSTGPMSAGPARSAGPCCRSTITRRSESGGNARHSGGGQAPPADEQASQAFPPSTPFSRSHW